MKSGMRGHNEMAAKLRQVGVQKRQQMIDGVRERAEMILRDAQARCPVKSGALRDSGKVVMHVTDREIRAVISFGGESVDYAVIQHERLDLRHEKGEPKFLEHALSDAERTLSRELAAKIKF